MFIDKYFKKGDGINVVGRMESDKYTDKDGNNRISWKVNVDDVEFHYGKKGGSDFSSSNISDPIDQFAPIEDGDGGDLPF